MPRKKKLVQQTLELPPTLQETLPDPPGRREKQRPRTPAPARSISPSVPSLPPVPRGLDRRIYGLDRPMRDEPVSHQDTLTLRQRHRWRRRNLPLKPFLTDHDLTPQGQLDYLRLRGYTPEEIREAFPQLADFQHNKD